jgi:8-oxo-dGTP pyrophosphatase MutT (NUDIX family)
MSSRGRKASEVRTERSAGGVVFRIADGRPLFLLIRDSYGNWGFPKGHLEVGERADTAALREVMEETGLRSLTVVGPITTIEWEFRFKGAPIHKTCQFFLMESASAETRPQKSEGITACRWATADEGRALILYENARGVLRGAQELVAARLADIAESAP